VVYRAPRAVATAAPPPWTGQVPDPSRRARKNSRRSAPAGSARTPPSTSIRWFTPGSARRSTTEPAAPPFGSPAP